MTKSATTKPVKTPSNRRLPNKDDIAMFQKTEQALASVLGQDKLRAPATEKPAKAP